MRISGHVAAAALIVAAGAPQAEAGAQERAMPAQLKFRDYRVTGKTVQGGSLAPGVPASAQVLERADAPPLLAYPLKRGAYEDWLVVASNQVLVSLRSAEEVAQVRRALAAKDSGLEVADEVPGRAVLQIRATSDAVLTPAEVLQRLIAVTGITPSSAEPLQQGMPNDAQDRQYARDAQPWAHRNRGGGGDNAKPDADIDGNEALSRLSYATTYGPVYRNPVVMVIDSGVDIAHPALVQNIWRNGGEIPGDRIDNDGNGYVDDINGWNFFGNNNDVGALADHGTHVAGIIAGKPGGSPARPAVRGLALRSPIMVGKVRVEENNGLTQVIKALEYARRQKASIVNLSLGFKMTSPALSEVIADLDKQEAIVVAAAGNAEPGEQPVDLRQSPRYPCMTGHVLCVAASDSQDKLASYSYYGASFGELGQPGVVIAAPGSYIMSTVPGGGYDFKSGTSMATPMVTGVLAATWSVHPTASRDEVRNRVIFGSDRASGLTAEQVEQSRRLNAYRAIFGRPGTGLSSESYCNETITDPQTGQRWRRWQQSPFANSEEPGIDGASIAGAFTICTTAQLVNIQGDMLDRVFVLKTDIDWKRDTSGSHAYSIGGRDGAPQPFNGILDGGGFTIEGLDQGRPANAGLIAWLGPRGHVFNMRFKNVRLAAVNVAGVVAVRNDGGRIFNVQAEGTVNAPTAGGLVGGMYGGEIRYASFEGAVSGTARVGGIAGQMVGETSRIVNSVFVGQLDGRAEIGGIVGYLGYGARVSASHAEVDMPPYAGTRDMAGGIAGYLLCRARIENSYAEGLVRASAMGGALAGRMTNADISHAYGSVLVTPDLATTGGTVGEIKDGIKIDQTNYMCSNTPAKPPASTRTKDYFDSFQGMTGNGTAMTQAQLRDPANFPTWNHELWDKGSGQLPALKNLPRSTHRDY